MGYSVGAALADLIDNSIAAGARAVDIDAHWKRVQGPAITILDDGAGMDQPMLLEAFRLGGGGPTAERAATDLGRFGMGLKTASLSQCRRLTVASSRGGTVSCLRWDLDVLAQDSSGAWYVLEGAADGAEDLVGTLSRVATGTVVVWELLDRVVTRGFTEADLLDLLDRVELHLSTVFQRYLEGPQARLRIRINGREVRATDPFLESHEATWCSPVERLRCGRAEVRAQGFVLPHKDRLSPRQQESAGGVDGWTSHQGFYVYRADRLLLAGGWLGLGQPKPWTREEAHRLARIRIEIPNAVDVDWKIDISKSSARPPLELRDRLTSLASDVRSRARRVFAHRGQIAPRASSEVENAWEALNGADGMRYRISRQHAAVEAVLQAAGGLAPHVEAMLRVIEESVPVQRIWLDTAEGKEAPRNGFANCPPQDVLQVAGVLFRQMIERKGLSPAEAVEMLLKTEPFHLYPDLVRGLRAPEGAA